MKQILIQVAEGHVKLLDELVSEKFFGNRNEAIREAIRLLLQEQHKL